MTLCLYTDELLNRQTIIFHSASLIWSILFNLSSLIGTNIIFKFFANIFSTIFIMLAIFNLILLAAARDDSERATWIVLLSLMTGPTSITSFTLILCMNYDTLKPNQYSQNAIQSFNPSALSYLNTQRVQVVYIPPATSHSQPNDAESI